MISRVGEPLPTKIFSISFMLYFFINFLIHLYQTSGRNAPSHSQSSLAPDEAGGIELRTPLTAGESWYSRVPTASAPAENIITDTAPRHVIGDDED